MKKFQLLKKVQEIVDGDGKLFGMRTRKSKAGFTLKYHNSFCRKNHCDEFIIPQDLINKKKRELKSI